jgi:TonB-linked SusC/RagA family outer membrane protein
MKQIYLLRQTLFFKVCTKKISKITRLTVLFLMVGFFNFSGTVAFAHNKTRPEKKDATINLTSDKIVDRNSTADMQQTRITGTITDENGSPFPGVYILVEGTTTGTISDVNGKYSLDVPNPNAVLVVTFVGYSTQRISLAGKTTVDLVMSPDLMNLDEVVVVGYSTARRATITGSVATVTGDKLAIAKATNFTNTLVGRLPGLVAVQRSGLPGADDATIRIRGNNTLNNNNPLIVVDGIAGRSMSRLNAADIESVVVLKDASAAIYGAQAANGVILITTRRGAVGKLKVNVDYNQGFSSPTVLPDMADSYLYATMMNEVDMYAGQNPRFSADDLQKYKDGSDPWGHPNTDWFHEVFKPVSMENKANISLTGGTESVKYFVSIGSRFQDGTYRKSGANYSQVDFRSNIDGKLADNINFSIDVAGRNENRKNTIYSEYETFRQTPRGKPTDVAWYFGKYPGPDVESDENPVAMVTNMGGFDRDKRYILESNLKLNINIPWIKGLSVTGNASIDKSFLTDKLWKIPFYLYTWDKLTYDDEGLPKLNASKRGVSQPQLTQRSQTGGRTTLNALVNYEHRIAEKHRIKILAGSEVSKGISETFQASRKYFVSSSIDQLFAGGDLEKDNTGSASESARMNYFGRVNYDFMSKYLVEFVWRYDGSYIFPADKRWGFFPGFSIGWVASEENFWKNNIPFINYLKLRGSWGQTGNDRIDEFQYLSVYRFASGWGNLESGLNMGEWLTNRTTINKVLYEQSIPNLNVTWEVANQTDIGIDLQTLGGKLKFEGDYFHNLRSNILTRRNASVPGSTGLTLPPENIGKVVNQGFEYIISYGDKAGNFTYDVSFNGGYAKNIIKFWDETPGIPEYQQTTGYPMNSQLYYQAIGIFKDQTAVDNYPHWVGARPGDIIFEDVNDDDKIDGLDQVRDYRSNIPVFTSGLNIDLTYKNFYATVLFQGAWGKIRYHYVEGGVSGNYFMEDAEGRWTPDNTDAKKPRAFSYTGEYWRSQNNTYWLRSADYVRLKNMEIGYNLPQSIISKLRITGFRIYVGGLNLITWCPALPSWDPESTAQDYPLSKVINVGAALTF